MLKEISREDINFYIEYIEKRTKIIRKKHNLNYEPKIKVGDVVKIVDLPIDMGYEGQLGIVINKGLIGGLYVLTYDTQNKRYWSCSFSEKSLIKLDRDMEEMGKLYVAYKETLLENNFKSGGFLGALDEYKKGNVKDIGTNVIYVDFVNRCLK